METNVTFKFLNVALNRQLRILLDKSKIAHAISSDGTIHYSPEDEGVVENDFIGSIRSIAFSSWQVLTCPNEWTTRYKKYMKRHKIPYYEELSNGELWFLLPRKYRPSLWKLDDSTKAERLATR